MGCGLSDLHHTYVAALQERINLTVVFVTAMVTVDMG